MTRHYLDHASTTPMVPAAVEALYQWLDAGAAAGDPARIHAEGLAARAAVEEARSSVAVLAGCRSRSVVFTSGATEAIAAAVWGAVERAAGHVVVSAVEHSAVRLASAQFAGAVTVVGCDGVGRIDPDEVLAAVRPGETALVHVQWGNHEVGTLQPVAEIVYLCRERDVLVHVDAAQGFGLLPTAFDALGADLMSVSAHKMGGPPGVGALLVRRGLRVRPLLVGADQERARRAGLENVPALVAWGAACEFAARRIAADSPGRETELTSRVVAAATAVEGIHQYGDPVPAGRLPHIACFGVDGVEPQAVLLGLDQAGIAVHSGSACASEGLQPSPVLEAMGVDAHHSLRVSVGWNTTDDDVDAFATALPTVLDRLRALGAR